MLAQKRYQSLLWLVLLVSVVDHASTTAIGRTKIIDPSIIHHDRLDSQRKVVHRVNIDDLIDTNINAIQEALVELDPFNLVDLKFPITPHIYMNLHTGWLQNLSLVKRAGECMLSYSNKLITADMILGWDSIAFDYRYLLNVLFVKKHGDVHGLLSRLNLNIVFEVDLESYKVTLRRLDFGHSGDVSIRLEGHKLDKIYNVVLKAVTKICKRQILSTIQTMASSMVQKKIDEINEKIGKNHSHVFQFAQQSERSDQLEPMLDSVPSQDWFQKEALPVPRPVLGLEMPRLRNHVKHGLFRNSARMYQNEYGGNIYGYGYGVWQ